MAATGMPLDEPPSLVATFSVLPQHPALPSESPMPQAFDAPMRLWFKLGLDLLRCLAREQVRIAQDLIDRHPFKNGATADTNASGRSRYG